MISVRLDKKLEEQLNFYAKEQNIPKSKIIKESLAFYFKMLEEKEQKKSAYELGQDLFGKYSSNKGDLSRTYKEKIKEKIRAKNAH